MWENEEPFPEYSSEESEISRSSNSEYEEERDSPTNVPLTNLRVSTRPRTARQRVVNNARSRPTLSSSSISALGTLVSSVIANASSTSNAVVAAPTTTVSSTSNAVVAVTTTSAPVSSFAFSYPPAVHTDTFDAVQSSLEFIESKISDLILSISVSRLNTFGEMKADPILITDIDAYRASTIVSAANLVRKLQTALTSVTRIRETDHPTLSSRVYMQRTQEATSREQQRINDEVIRIEANKRKDQQDLDALKALLPPAKRSKLSTSRSTSRSTSSTGRRGRHRDG